MNMNQKLSIPLFFFFAAVLHVSPGGLSPLSAMPSPKKETQKTPRAPATRNPEKEAEVKEAPAPETTEPSETAKRQPEDMVRIFLDIYKTRGGASAVDYIYSNNPYIFEKKEHMGTMKEKLGRLPSMLGKNCGEVLIQDRMFKGTIRIISYMVKHERQPLRFTFVFYRPADRWITYQFGFDDALTEDVIKETQRLGLEPVVQ